MTARPAASHERIIVIAGFALLAVALIVALMRGHHDAPPARVPPPQEARVVTVPVPMPVEQPAPVPAPPAPVPVVVPVVAHPAPRPVAIATPTQKPAEVPAPVGTPTAAELAALYREVGTTLQKLDHDKPRTADDLWVRYRWIRLADYLTTPDKRSEAARLLTAIASDARRQ